MTLGRPQKIVLGALSLWPIVHFAAPADVLRTPGGGGPGDGTPGGGTLGGPAA